jgi:hypothetical protein
MTWLFSLPQPLEVHRRLNIPIDWAYGQYKHIILVGDGHTVWRDTNELEESCMHNFAFYIIDRVLYDKWNKRWCSNSIGGGDEIFIVTNYDEGATILSLRWS